MKEVYMLMGYVEHVDAGAYAVYESEEEANEDKAACERWLKNAPKEPTLYTKEKWAEFCATMDAHMATAPLKECSQFEDGFYVKAVRYVESDSAVEYQWLADGKPIDGATSSSYTLTEADIGKEIEVDIRPTTEDRMTSLERYVDTLAEDSFAGWSEDAENGYMTAIGSIRAFIKESATKGEQV